MNKKNKNLIRLSVLFWVFSFFVSSINDTNAYSGCSEYGSFAYSDGLGGCKCMSGYIWGTNIYGIVTCVSCSSKYGYGAISDYSTGSCKCMSGYIWGTNLLGERKCVSGNSECSDQYGYGATYDSLSGKCKCRSGYIWGTSILGKDECVSEGQYCRDNYGYNSRFNSLTDKCECGYGYEFTLKSFGSGLECESCFSKYGLHSSYDALTKECGCNSGYTLDENSKCVEKQNNVYFILKELNTASREAIIKSKYDGRNYKISYGTGCLYRIDNYLNREIVINLGTDFNLDAGDKIVLQDYGLTCNIVSKEYVCSDYGLNNDEEATVIPNPLKNVEGVDYTAYGDVPEDEKTEVNDSNSIAPENLLKIPGEEKKEVSPLNETDKKPVIPSNIKNNEDADTPDTDSNTETGGAVAIGVIALGATGYLYHKMKKK